MQTGKHFCFALGWVGLGCCFCKNSVLINSPCRSGSPPTGRWNLKIIQKHHPKLSVSGRDVDHGGKRRSCLCFPCCKGINYGMYTNQTSVSEHLLQEVCVYKHINHLLSVCKLNTWLFTVQPSLVAKKPVMSNKIAQAVAWLFARNAK